MNLRSRRSCRPSTSWQMSVTGRPLCPDEIREPDFAAPSTEAPVRAQGLKTARSLMDTLSEDFDLDEPHDDYVVALKELIDSKLDDKPVPAGQPAPTGGCQPLDLMGALQSSVQAARQAHTESDETAAQQPTAKKFTVS